MKHLYLIGGPMGVGKTALGQHLKHSLDNAIFLDGDWCWNADPFIVNDETIAMVTDNICYLLNCFLHSTVYENIVFCWVLHQQSIIDEILGRLDTENCDVRVISFLASEETLRQRILCDIQAGTRSLDVVQRSLDRLPLYQTIQSYKIQTDVLSVEQIAEIVIGLSGKIDAIN